MATYLFETFQFFLSAPALMKKHVRIYGSQLVFGFGLGVFWYTAGIRDLLVLVHVVVWVCYTELLCSGLVCVFVYDLYMDLFVGILCLFLVSYLLCINALVYGMFYSGIRLARVWYTVRLRWCTASLWWSHCATIWIRCQIVWENIFLFVFFLFLISGLGFCRKCRARTIFRTLHDAACSSRYEYSWFKLY